MSNFNRKFQIEPKSDNDLLLALQMKIDQSFEDLESGAVYSLNEVRQTLGL